MGNALYINDCGMVSALGRGVKANAKALFADVGISVFQPYDGLPELGITVGAVQGMLPLIDASLSMFDSRNNQLLQLTITEIRPSIDRAIARYGADRIAVIMGTSTSGIDRGEDAFAAYQSTGQWPEDYDYRQQEAGSPSAFVAEFLNITGPAYTVATACSSSAKVFASARRLIDAGIVDAAIVGGADTLCRMTVQGFHSLQILSPTVAKPFSANRDGITIGEAAAVFLVSGDVGPVQLLGVGETADAYHVTAPDPQGVGASESMRAALRDANLRPQDIHYINMHGTATPLNDAAESYAVFELFGSDTPTGSTKGLTGHTLGASGACEAAILWITLNPQFNPGYLPPHVWDGAIDMTLPTLNFVAPQTALSQQGTLAMLSNSFGFGGSNVSLIFGRTA